MLDLAPRFQQCVSSARAEENGHANASTSAEDVDDEDFAKGAARLFVELGEAYTAMIASGNIEKSACSVQQSLTIWLSRGLLFWLFDPLTVKTLNFRNLTISRIDIRRLTNLFNLQNVTLSLRVPVLRSSME